MTFSSRIRIYIGILGVFLDWMMCGEICVYCIVLCLLSGVYCVHFVYMLCVCVDKRSSATYERGTESLM